MLDFILNSVSIRTKNSQFSQHWQRVNSGPWYSLLISPGSWAAAKHCWIVWWPLEYRHQYWQDFLYYSSNDAIELICLVLALRFLAFQGRPKTISGGTSCSKPVPQPGSDISGNSKPSACVAQRWGLSLLALFKLGMIEWRQNCTMLSYIYFSYQDMADFMQNA